MMLENGRDPNGRSWPKRAGRALLIAGLAAAGFVALFVLARVALQTTARVSVPAPAETERVVASSPASDEPARTGADLPAASDADAVTAAADVSAPPSTSSAPPSIAVAPPSVPSASPTVSSGKLESARLLAARPDDAPRTPANGKPPALAVVFPPPRTFDAECTVEGRAAAGSRVRVASVPAATDAAGRFHASVALQPGPNLVIVEAADAAGNTAYRSLVVTRLEHAHGGLSLSADSSRVAKRLATPATGVLK
ncbi:MAG: hypothetical protein ACKVU1_13200 [bacterium]